MLTFDNAKIKSQLIKVTYALTGSLYTSRNNILFAMCVGKVTSRCVTFNNGSLSWCNLTSIVVSINNVK